MIIADNARKQQRDLQWIVDTCMGSAKTRKELYERRRQYFLFGTASDAEIIYNRIESHLDLVASFLYSSDHAQFALAAPLNSDDAQVKQYLAAQDSFNADCRDANLFDIFGDAIIGALVYDTMVAKVGWSDVHEEPTCKLICPWQFGVFSEELGDLGEQQAFVHTYHIDYDQACQRLIRAGLADRIKDLNVVNTPFDSPFPELITRMIISSTSGENLSGNVTGSVNPSYIARPSYRAEVDRPLVAFRELWVWDDDAQDSHGDYRVFFMMDNEIILSDSKKTIAALKNAGGFAAQREQMRQFYNTDSNPFFPREHPFVQITPYPIYEYFWGKAHIDSLIPLQMWSNERLDQIHDILERQAYPPRVMSGFLGLSDEKAEAFGGADSWVVDQLPQASVNELHPQMPPDIFADYQAIGALFMEASGLTDILMGKGAPGVRSKGQAKEAASTGSGRIKKAATRLEEPLVRMGDLTFKLNMRNNDDPITPDPQEGGRPGNPFYYANMVSDYTLRVAGHSHSPLFRDDTQELTAFLYKAQAIDREALLRLLNPPNRDNLIHALRARERRAAIAQAMRAQTPGGGSPPSGKVRRKANGSEAQA
jgi:hypothetical protein